MHVLVVGSSVIDMFLELKDEADAKFSGNTVSLQLGDKIPTNIKRLALGGNGANISVGLKRLMVDATFYTYTGSDILSSEIIEGLTSEGVKLLAQKTEGGHSDLSLIFNFDTDRIIFSHHSARNHDFSYSEGGELNYIYLTSIGKEWTNAYQHVLDFAKYCNVPIAFSPGSQQLTNMNQVFDDVFKSSRMLLMNRDEAKQILNHFDMNENIIENMLKKLKSYGAHIVSITDGKKGAWTIDGFEKIYHIDPIPADSHERTGAGDSYASGFMAGILQGKETPEAMRWGIANAYSVIQKTGAQSGLLTQGELNMILSVHTDLRAEELE